MPALVLFNRRWYVNGDEVFIPALVEIFFRAAWLMAIAIVFHDHKEKLQVGECHLVWTYYIGSLVLIPLSIFLSMIGIHISLKGSIMDMAARRYLPIILYLKMVLAVPEVAWNILGTFWAYSKVSGCTTYVATALKVYVIGGWIFFVIISMVILVFLGFFQKRSVDQESYVKVWEERCNTLFCCKSKKTKNHNALQDVAKLVAPFFANSDLVPTDIVAGLLLVREKQEQEELARLKAKEFEAASKTSNSGLLDHVVVTSMERTENGTNKLLDFVDVPVKDIWDPIASLQDWMHLDNIKYYLKFAMAMYGWPLHMVINMGCGICQLARYCRCCSYSHVPKGDNCCQCNMAAFYKLTENFNVKILHVSFQNEVFQSPFIVSVDHKNCAVVVSIRGSLSLEDAITDMSAVTEIAKSSKLEFQCHRGILQTAYYVKNILEEHSLLEKGFQDTGTEQIVVTGHSLGAGVAAILSILLKDKYDDVRCFAYAPPGGLLGPRSSDYSKDFIVSTFFGDDIIPRLSLRNIEKLKNEIVSCISACPLPKYKILMDNFLWNHEKSKFVNEMREKLDELEKPLHQEQLYPPGVVLYVKENKTKHNGFRIFSCSQETCSMEWFTPDQFQEIRLSSSIVSDHLPDALDNALDRLVFTPFDV